MIKKTLALLCCMIGLSAAAQNSIYVEDLTVTAGESAIVTVKMDEPSAVSAVQFTLTIPAGVTVTTNANGRPELSLVSERVSGTDHAVSGSLNGSEMNVMVYSASAQTLNSVSSGDLLTFTITADENLDGDYPITVSNIIASDASLNAVTLSAGSGVVTITQPITLAEAIAIDRQELELTLNDSYQLLVSIMPATASQVVEWSSGDPSIASVDNQGYVMALGVGSTTIFATTTDGTVLTATCQVTVIPPQVESITLNESSLTIGVNEGYQLSATVLPAEAAQGVTWSSSDSETVSVDSSTGYITGLRPGNATITATATDGSGVSASCEVTVTVPLVESITLNYTDLMLIIGEGALLEATIEPEYASQEVSWESSDQNIVQVDDYGNITAMSPGEATITATATDDSGISASCHITVNQPLAESITLNYSNLELIEGESFQLEATISPETALQGVTWSSDNENIVTVNDNGYVTAVAVGETVVRATTVDGSNLSTECYIDVTGIIAESITLDKSEATMVVGETMDLILTILPVEALQEADWTSSNTAVATVDENGTVTAVAVGEAVITASTTDGSDLSASCTVTVVPPTATAIALNKSETSLNVGDTEQLTATVSPELASQEVTWASSDETIATVDTNGLVTAVAVGEVVITATTTDGSNLSAECNVTVVLPTATAIALNKSETSLNVGDTEQLIATVSPELASQEVTWASSDETIASVDANGLVTAVAVGEAVITATTTDGSNLSASCTVTVTENTVPVTALMLAVNVPLNRPIQINVTASPADATNPELSWSSADETIATVEDGKVSGVALGRTVITVATTDGSGLSLSLAVNVVEAEPGKLNDADVNNDGFVNGGDVSAVYEVILSGE